jgi:polar amino acid transport system substrate-binding protein
MRLNPHHRLVVIALAVLGGLAAVAVAQTEVATGPFTEAQIEEGRKVYAVHCAACHLPSMVGQGEALPLAGSQFMAGWSNRTTQDLYNLIHSSMPQSAPGSLDDQSYANVTAFILHANGAKAGPTAFLAAPPLRIGLIVNGIAPGDIGAAAPASSQR